MPVTLFIAEKNEENAVASVWIKPSGATTARVFDPRTDRFDLDPSAEFSGASKLAMEAWLKRSQLEPTR